MTTHAKRPPRLTAESLHQRLALRRGQARKQPFIRSCYWYDARGAELGTGDLSQRDMQRIAEKLLPGEAFLVLRQLDAHHRLSEQSGGHHWWKSMPRKKRVEYLQRYAYWYIVPGTIYHAWPSVTSRDRHVETTPAGMTFTHVSRDRFTYELYPLPAPAH